MKKIIEKALQLGADQAELFVLESRDLSVVCAELPVPESVIDVCDPDARLGGGCDRGCSGHAGAVFGDVECRAFSSPGWNGLRCRLLLWRLELGTIRTGFRPVGIADALVLPLEDATQPARSLTRRSVFGRRLAGGSRAGQVASRG